MSIITILLLFLCQNLLVPYIMVDALKQTLQHAITTVILLFTCQLSRSWNKDLLLPLKSSSHIRFKHHGQLCHRAGWYHLWQGRCLTKLTTIYLQCHATTKIKSIYNKKYTVEYRKEVMLHYWHRGMRQTKGHSALTPTKTCMKLFKLLTIIRSLLLADRRQTWPKSIKEGPEN